MKFNLEPIIWRLLERQKSYIIMQAKIFRESEIITFNRDKENAENLVDHLQNWIDGIIPLIVSEKDFFKKELGIYLTEVWPSLQFMIFSILGGAYFDAIRNLRYSLESVLFALSSFDQSDDRPSYYHIIDSLSIFTTVEKQRIKALHGKLSQLVHPSPSHLQKLLKEPGRAFTLFYDQTLFRECCSYIDEVVGVIFSVVLELYPQIKDKVKREKYFYASLKRLPFASNRI